MCACPLATQIRICSDSQEWKMPNMTHTHHCPLVDQSQTHLSWCAMIWTVPGVQWSACIVHHCTLVDHHKPICPWCATVCTFCTHQHNPHICEMCNPNNCHTEEGFSHCGMHKFRRYSQFQNDCLQWQMTICSGIWCDAIHTWTTAMLSVMV